MQKTSDVLTCILRAALLRRRLRRGVFASGVLLAVGTCLAFVFLITGFSSRTVFLPPVFFIFGFLGGILFPVSGRNTARLIDEQLALRGRLVTAFEIGSENSYPESVIEVQRQDACRKVAEILSAEPDFLLRVIPLDFRSLFMSFLFYLSFAALILTIPPDRFQITGHALISPSQSESDEPKSPDELLNRTRSVVEKAAEENPQMTPLGELSEKIMKMPSFRETDGSSAVSALREWETALSQAVKEIVASDVDRTKEGKSFPNEEIQENGAAVASLLREELGRIIGCRLKMSESLSRSGGDGTADPGKSRKTWGSGDAGESSPKESDSSELYEGTVDLTIPGSAALENLTADTSDPNDLSSVEGHSIREAESVFPPSHTVEELPVKREVIPPEREELVKKYFDY